MNHTYRIVWNQVLNTWVAVAESARGRGKGASRTLVAAALSLTASFAQAAPAGGQVASGAGSIAQSGNTTTITQSSQNLSLNWQSFNVAKQETVNFVQPSASAIAVNRIFDTNGSQILGQINANGQVVLVNPNGILFGQGAQVNVGGLVASTLDLNDASLTSATRTFSGTGAGSIVNQGTITAASGGYVALLGNTVSNQGTMTAPLGTVALGAGNAVTLNFNGNSLVQMQIDQSVLSSLAENGALIQADGGLVVMSAGAKDALLASVVNNTGKIEARTVENHNGTIVLMGGMAAGTVNVGGTLDASAPNGGNGGFIETSAANVQVASDARVTTLAPAGHTGTWLIDPHNLTIANATGNTGGSFVANTDDSVIDAAALQTALASTNVTVSTGASGSQAGNITVAAPLTWSAATTLGLTAAGGIAINAPINITGAGGLTLTASASPGITTTGLTFGNGAAVTYAGGGSIVGQAFSLNGTNYTLVHSMAQLDAIDAINAVDGSALLAYGAGNAGNYALATNLDATGTTYTRALFGANSAPTRLAGRFDGMGHTITGLTINAPSGIGVGLIGGTAAGGSVSNLGLVGGSVTGMQFVGALVGQNFSSAVVQTSYASTTVSGTTNTGGLLGGNGGTLQASFATGAVTGGNRTGGLVGYNNAGTITNSYASGTVTGVTSTGGLLGQNSQVTGLVQSSYATGAVISTDGGGGLVGASGSGNPVVMNSYWDTQTTGRSTSLGGTGLTTAQLQGTSTSSLSAAFTGGAAGGTVGLYPYLASAFTGGIQAVSGTAYKDAGATVAASDVNGLVFIGLTLNGLAQTPVATGANGYYYVALPTGTIDPNGTTLLATTTANGANGVKNGAAITRAIGSTAGLDIYGGYLPFSTAATTYSTAQDASAPLRALVSGYATTPAFVANLPSLITATGAGFNIDQALNVSAGFAVRTTAANAAITVTAPITVGGAAPLTLTAAGALTVSAPITLTGTSTATLTGGTGLTVGAPITLSGTNALTLASGGPLMVGQTVHVNGAGSVTFRSAPQPGLTATGLSFASGASVDYGTADLGGSFSLNGSSYKLVYSMNNLDAIDSLNAVDGTALSAFGAGLTGSYALATNLVATGTTYTRALISTDTSGSSTAGFTGRLDGLGNTITGLTITPSTLTDSVGLIGSATNSTVSNMGLVGGSVTGHDNVGALVGYSYGSTIQTSFANGAVSGNKSVGGLIGGTRSFTLIQSSYTNGTVTGFIGTGGLVGDLNFTSALKSSYSTSAVSGGDSTGGLAGDVSVSSVLNSYATGAVTGTTNTGGLIGLFNPDGTNVVTGSFWNTQTSGQLTSGGGGGAVGLTTAQMQSQTNFTSATAANGNLNPAWDFANTWLMYDTFTSPLLRSFLAPMTVTANTATKTYDGLAYAGANGVTYSSTPNGNLFGTVSYTDASQGAVNAGSYAVTPGGLYSNQQGYAVTYVSGGLTVNRRALTVTADAKGKTYGDVNPALTVTVAVDGVGTSQGLVNGDTVSGSLSTAATQTSGAGSYTIDASALLVNGNYVVTANNGTLTIDKADLTLSGTQVYNGGTAYAGASLSAAGVNGETFSVSGAGDTSNLSSKNVQTGSALATVTGLAVATGNTSAAIASNYNALTTSGSSVNVTAADLTLSTSNISKIYDAGLAALGTATKVGGLTTVTGDTLSGGTFAFSDKNVGSGSKTVTTTGVTVHDGNNGGNYNITYADNTTSTISKADLAVSGLAASNKIYDANTTATLTGSAAINKLGSDDVTLGGTASGTFVSKNVGTQGVTVSGNNLTGTDAGNYNLVLQSGLTADITKADLVVSGLAASNKVYDASTTATLTGSAVITKLGSDDVTLDGTAISVFADANVGTGKSVTVSGNTLTGTDAGNYNLLQPSGLAADITALPAVEPPVQDTVRNAITQLVSTLSDTTMGGQPGPLNPSSTISVAQNSSLVPPDLTTGTAAAGAAGAIPSFASDQGEERRLAMNIGAQGSTLQIISGGVKLPGNRVNVNE